MKIVAISSGTAGFWFIAIALLHIVQRSLAVRWLLDVEAVVEAVVKALRSVVEDGNGFVIQKNDGPT